MKKRWKAYFRFYEKSRLLYLYSRMLAFKWIWILYRCWKTKDQYSEIKYFKVLSDRNSSLLFKEKAC